MAARRRYEFRVEHPSEQRAVLRRLKGETETPEDRQLVEALIADLEKLLAGRVRRRRLPSERNARKAQRALFRVRAKQADVLMPRHKKES